MSGGVGGLCDLRRRWRTCIVLCWHAHGRREGRSSGDQRVPLGGTLAPALGMDNAGYGIRGMGWMHWPMFRV